VWVPSPWAQGVAGSNPVAPTTFRVPGFQRGSTLRAMSSVTLRPLDFAPLPQQVPSPTVRQPISVLNAVLRPPTRIEPEHRGGLYFWYRPNEEIVSTTAKLFKNGRSQAVRLPREFRFEGDRVRVRRAGRGVLVEPVATDVTAWFAELDRLASEPFMPEGRQQPPTPERDVFE
jgi:antitoxin VapB